MRGLGSEGDSSPKAGPGDAGPNGVLGESMFFLLHVITEDSVDHVKRRFSGGQKGFSKPLAQDIRVACEVETVKLNRCGRTCYYEKAAVNNIKWPEFMPCLPCTAFSARQAAFPPPRVRQAESDRKGTHFSSSLNRIAFKVDHRIATKKAQEFIKSLSKSF